MFDSKSIIKIANNYGLVLVEESLKLNNSGLDFQVVNAVDKNGVKWILRLPRRSDVLPKMYEEKWILDLIHPQLPFEVPIWEITSDELVAYRLLKGKPVGTIDPDAKVYIWEIDSKNLPDNYLKSLAKALVSLHLVKIKDNDMKNKTITDVKNDLKNRMEIIKTEFGVGDNLWHKWQDWLANPLIWPERTGFCHGDLHPGHILIDEENNVTGIIDWTEAQVADCSQDFVSHYFAFGLDSLKSLLAYYEEYGGYVWSGMVEHIIELGNAYPLLVAEFAIISGLDEYKNYAKNLLGVE